MSNITDLIGQTIVKITNDKFSIDFYTESGKHYIMGHDQNCCEYVELEDICGNLQGLIGSPVHDAFIKTNTDSGEYLDKGSGENYQWTFYTIVTMFETVTLRWYGEADCYSIDVDFDEIKWKDEWRNIQ